MNYRYMLDSFGNPLTASRSNDLWVSQARAIARSLQGSCFFRTRCTFYMFALASLPNFFLNFLYVILAVPFLEVLWNIMRMETRIRKYDSERKEREKQRKTEHGNMRSTAIAFTNEEVSTAKPKLLWLIPAPGIATPRKL